MKKTITLVFLLIFFKGITQCPAPSNLVYSSPNGVDALLTWTENGNADTWEIVAVPDFYVGAPSPSEGSHFTTSNSFAYVGLPPGCNVFFVRSVCSSSEVSPWVAVASFGCPINIINYLETLSQNSFLMDEHDKIKIFPNPSSDFFKIESDAIIDKVTLFDSSGKEVFIETQNTREIDIEKLPKGMYLVEMVSEGFKIYRKLMKE